jgi:hypothetical protein
MRTLKNTLKKLELHVLIGLGIVSTIILPCIVFIIQNIIQGNFQSW